MNQRIPLGVLTVLTIFLISSCAVLPWEEELPTLMPEEYVPTAIALTAQALVAKNASLVQEVPTLQPSLTQQPSPTKIADLTPPPAENITSTPEPTLDSDQSENTPSPTIILGPTPEITLPSRIPFGNIQFLAPGQLSKIASPIQLHAYLTPGNNNRVWVALFGEDGRLLIRNTYTMISGQEYKVHLKEDLVFEIPGAAETARLEISTFDEYGRVSALATRDLVLISSGGSDVNLPRDLYEGIVIQQPAPRRLIQGGELIVTGITRYAPEGELHVEVLDAQDGVIASQVIGVSEKELGEGYRPYAGEIPYQIGSPIWVRVLISARDGRMSDVVHVSSVIVLLSP